MPNDQQLTESEELICDSLPGPPPNGGVKPNHIWIIEWLPPSDPATGTALDEWLRSQRPRWSTLVHCESKTEVLLAVQTAAQKSRELGMIPILHLEAHGGPEGLEGPDGSGESELLAWAELTAPLQLLNEATACNLLVFVAACLG